MDVQKESSSDEPFKMEAKHFAYFVFYVHNAELSLNDEFKPDVDDYFRRSSNCCATIAGCHIELRFCIQTALTIGNSLSKRVKLCIVLHYMKP